MALIDRVKERIEHQLFDPELQRLIDEANQEIIDRWGPAADPANPITAQLDGGDARIFLARPIDPAHPVTVTEFVSSAPWGGETSTVLSANDWRSWHGGRTLQRLGSGANPRTRWGERVTVQYTPQNDGNQRQETIIKLVQLAVEYEGVDESTVGDLRLKRGDYIAKRERLIAQLAPRRGLLLA